MHNLKTFHVMPLLPGHESELAADAEGCSTAASALILPASWRSFPKAIRP